MKQKIIALGVLFASLFSSAQTNMWTWVNGSSSLNQYGNYGVIDVAAPTNSVGSRIKGGTWTDNSNNLWVFGGLGNSGSATGYLNDLWKYDITSNQWTWKKGMNSTDVNGVYGGFIPTNNNPGSRAGMVTWVDSNGDFWMFGGTGYAAAGGLGKLNDLWKYEVATNQWWWIHGSNSLDQPGTYGTLGASNSANTPGAREGAVSWTDSNGNLWLFGGTGYATSATIGQLNDLWTFNTTVLEWTWVGGSNTIDQVGTYGTLGVGSATNIPGGRSNMAGFRDGNNDLWLFGGNGFATTSTAGDMNDLWKYNILLNEWTWMKGANVISQAGTYGTQGVFAAANTPGARQFGKGWNTNTQLYLFGGATGSNVLNDLWKFDTGLNEWMWMNGSNTTNQTATYGTMGVAASTNSVGARQAALNWMDNSGNLWLFGGDGYNATTSGNLNDLWKFEPCQAPSAPWINSPILGYAICSNGQETLTASGSGTISWYNTPTGGTPLGTGTSYTTPVLTTGTSPTTYTFYAEDFTCAASDTRASVEVTVNPVPTLSVASSASIMCAGYSATLTASGASTYTWLPSGSGSTIVVSPTVTSGYTVSGTNSYGCDNSTSFTQSVSPCTGINELSESSSVNVYPNPFTNKVTISSETRNGSIQVLNSLGDIVCSVKVQSNETELDLNHLSSGVYFISIKSATGTEVRKIIKQ